MGSHDSVRLDRRDRGANAITGLRIDFVQTMHERAAIQEKRIIVSLRAAALYMSVGDAALVVKRA